MRQPVSSKQNSFFNGEDIDNNDLILEQDHNNLIQNSLIINHIGSGILSENLIQKVLFDSNLASGLLDGKALDIQSQPDDSNFGNQIEVELQNSLAAGKRAIKVFIIGLDFESNLQYDTLIFHRNEKQMIGRHYTQILKILFNDFIGDPSQSLNLGGRIIIRETKSLSLARDCIMVAQDVQPNIFIRDFVVASSGTLLNALTAALPNYNIDLLNITSNVTELRALIENDVSSQIGQKFQATTNNIQKITLLLSVINLAQPSNLVWSGDLIVSIFQLQSALDCPLDIAPGTAIDFDPSNIPLAQLSINYNTLLSRGIVLGATPQPIDFIFSNTPVGSGIIIQPNSYYAVTAKRAGSADTCAIQFAVGTDRLANSKMTLFNGAIWIDVPSEDMWFQVWTDSAKVADGQAYDAGHGVIVQKTQIDPLTGITEDFVLSNIPFVRNDVYYGVLEAITEQSVPVQDQRTGENVNSQQQFIPKISLITATNLINMEVAANPLLLGSISDKNAKAINIGTLNVSSNFHNFSMIKNQCIVKVITDATDGYRYDLTIQNLIVELTGSGGITNINGLLNGQFIPNTSNPNVFYRIADTEIISMIYGDLNGDGIVDGSDLSTLEYLIGSDLNIVPSRNDYITLTTLFQSDTALSWRLLAEDRITILQSGTDGILTSNPQDGTMAAFVSASASFNSVLSLSTKFLQIFNDNSNPGNNGIFNITGLISNTSIDIQKLYYTSDTILQVLRADINGDMKVDAADLTLLTNYINKVAPFPSPSSPGNNIGTEFLAIRFTLEEYVDRSDDYIATTPRGTTLHPLSDILMDAYSSGFSLFGDDLKDHPLQFNIIKQLNWYDYLVGATSNPKLVPSSFNYESGFQLNSCSLEGIVDDRYPLDPDFDPGRNDIFLPNNLILNNGGEIIRPDGYAYSVDFEVGTVIFEIPTGSFSSERTINLMTDLVGNYSGNGRTRLGLASMRFADCSFVSLAALENNQVRLNVAVRSFSPQLDGYDLDGYYGDIVDGRIGISLDTETGILTLNFTNLFEDPILQTMKTRVQITAYLKRAGFNNQEQIINSTMTKNLFGL